MITELKSEIIPEDHPVRQLFRTLTDRGMRQSNLNDPGTTDYVAKLLADYIPIDNMYRATGHSGERLEHIGDIISQAAEQISPSVRKEYYKHIGDFTLFNLGLFPESLTYGRHTVSPDYYADMGRRSYGIAAEMESKPSASLVLRKLSGQFEQCVVGLNWVKLYINDPFYQYMLREFKIT